MDPVTSLYSPPQSLAVVFLSSGVLAVVVAMQAARYRQWPIWRYLSFTMIAVAIWCFGDGMLFLSDDVEARRFWLTFAFIGRMAGVPLVCFFAIYFAHLERWLTRAVQWIILAPLLLAIALAVTNPWHGLIWEVDVDPLGLTGAPGHGAYFYIVMPIIYTILTATIVIFLQSVWRLRHVYRQQAIVLTIALCLPLMANVLYFTDLNPFPSADLASAAFALSGLLLLYSMKRLRLMDLRPIYRDALFDRMADGMIVADSSGRIADLNAVAREALAVADPIGQPALELLATLFRADSRPALHAGYHDTLETTDAPVRHLDVRVAALDSSAGQPDALLLVWRDVTALRTAVATVYEQERLMAVMSERRRVSLQLTTQIEQVLRTVQQRAQAALEQLDAQRPGIAATHMAAVADVAASAQQTAADLKENEAPPPSTFREALFSYIEHVAAGHDLAVTCDIPEINFERVLLPEQRLQVARILQEVMEPLTARTAESPVSVTVEAGPDTVTLTITGDSIGFDPVQADVQIPEVESLQNRARMAAATLTVEGAAGGGGTIRLVLPIAAEHASPLLSGLRIIMANRHPIVLEGIRNMLVAEGADVVAMITSADAAVAATAEANPDLVLLALDLPDDSSITAVQAIKQRQPDVAVVILLSSENDPNLAAALHAGADGYLLMTLEAAPFFASLMKVVAREAPLAPGLARRVLAEFRGATAPPKQDPQADHLTPRQKEILTLIAQGKTYADIAKRLYLSERTVRYHMDQIRAQLGLANRVEVEAYAQAHGYATSDLPPKY